MSATDPTRERPILFSAPMVRAILDGRKTQTRRVATKVRHYPERSRWNFVVRTGSKSTVSVTTSDELIGFCPYGVAGDRLWVRETFTRESDPITSKLTGRYFYAASDDVDFLDDGDGGAVVNKDGTFRSPWKPSIHMPRAACRIVLEIVSVRVERLQEISEADALAEGIDSGRIPVDDYGPERIGFMFGRDDGRSTLYPTARAAFEIGWDTINGKRAPWASNPFVWVVEFRRTTP